MKIERKVCFINDTTLENVKKSNFYSNRMLKNLGKDNIFETVTRKNVSKLMVLNRLLFELSGVTYGDLTYDELLQHINSITNHLYNYRQLGYVNGNILEANPVYKILRSIFVTQENVFFDDNPHSLFELEHLHNLILLCLIMEIDLFIQTKSDYSSLTDLQEEQFDFLRVLRTRILGNVSPAFRSVITMTRLSYIKRMYTAFDTEYNTLDSKQTKLLCYTTASYSELILRIKLLKFDYTITNHHGDYSSRPVTSNYIETVIKLIRLINGKNDVKIHKLENELRKSSIFECLTTESSLMFKVRRSDELKPSDFTVNFVELLKDPSIYSLCNLVKYSIDTNNISLENHLKLLNDFLVATGYDIQSNKIRIHKELYLIAHFTTADVCSWSDFNDYKTKFAILRKSFVSMGVITVEGWKILLRDTSLLTPTAQNLGAIGDLYSEYGLSKIDLPKEMKNDMEEMMYKDFTLFKEYAIRDSVITLFHAMKVQDSYQSFCMIYSIPITLSALANAYLSKMLRASEKNSKYHNPVINGKYSMKSLKTILTPVGIELSGSLHEYIDYFLGAYHGGRNESIIFGKIQGKFFDYDLPGAYPTGMSLLNYPDWSKIEQISVMDDSVFMSMYKNKLLKSYTAIKVEFEFPEHVMYPNLPVRLDQGAIFYPLKGVSFCTGLEILLASRLGCRFTVLGGVFIPFLSKKDKIELEDTSVKIVRVTSDLLNECVAEAESVLNIQKTSEMDTMSKTSEVDSLSKIRYRKNVKYVDEINDFDIESDFNKESTPNHTGLTKKEKMEVEKALFEEYPKTNFYNVVNELTAQRAKHAKKTYLNLLYKFIANAGIGQMARGLNLKKVFSTKTQSTVDITPGTLINPLYAGWITSFIRTVLAELMNHIHAQGGRIISCTTDGFICDLPDLDKIVVEGELGEFSRLYQLARVRLGFTNQLLEVKFVESEGIISWSTRGQLGLSSPIKAMTGYQATLPHLELVKLVNDKMDSNKQINFVQFSLRSALDIFKDGGMVTPILSERIFNLKYDNRRLLSASNSEVQLMSTHTNSIFTTDGDDKFLDCSGDMTGYKISRPYYSIVDCLRNRKLSSLGNKKFNTHYPSNALVNDKKGGYVTLTKRMLVRALLQHPEWFGLSKDIITRQFIVQLLSEIGIKCLVGYVSKQKDAPFIENTLPGTTKVFELLDRLTVKLPEFTKYRHLFIRR